MVITKNLNQKFALISVFDKGNLRYLCTNLKKYKPSEIYLFVKKLKKHLDPNSRLGKNKLFQA